MKLWRYGIAIELLGDRYRLTGILGSGGMADVCLATDELTQTEVAIKVIKPNELDQKTLNRFLKEASHIARLRHPHILRIYGDARFEVLDSSNGAIVPYIVMEYAPNGDLHKRLRARTPYPFADTLTIFSQLCQAVSYAHSQGIIHRDLKPLNILFLPNNSRPTTNNSLTITPEHAVLSDFGLSVSTNATHMTFAAGGTLPYMAPEQLRGHIQPASDIFALGVILYQLCTGRLPFRRTIQDLSKQGPLAPTPTLPSTLNPLLPPELDHIILTALSENPADRYPDALDLWHHIDTLITADTIQRITHHEQSQHHTASNLHLKSRAHAKIVNTGKSRDHIKIADTGKSRDGAEIGNAGLTRDHAKIENAGLTRTKALAASRILNASEKQQNSINTPIPHTNQSHRHTNIPSTPITNPTSKTTSTRYFNRPLYITTALLILFLLTATIASAFTKTPLTNLLPDTPLTPTQATITITTTHHTITQNYPIQSLNNSDPTQLQIPGHPLTHETTEKLEVKGTGKKETSGSTAKGKLTFYNGSFKSFSVGTSITITGPNGIEFITDNQFTIPPANPDTATNGSIDVPAHAVKVGKQGNVSTNAINQACCTTGNFVIVRNLTPFTGGQDPQTYTYIQQSDLDTATKPKLDPLTSTARNQLTQKLSANEKLASPPTCTTKPTYDPATIGDQGRNTSTTQVTLTATCTAWSYDAKAAQDLAQTRLQKHVTDTYGPDYTLTGNITTTVSNINQLSQSASMLITAHGTWTYHITDLHQQQLLRKLIGKKVTEAEQILKVEQGISKVDITFNTGGGNGMLPADKARIKLIITKM